MRPFLIKSLQIILIICILFSNSTASTWFNTFQGSILSFFYEFIFKYLTDVDCQGK